MSENREQICRVLTEEILNKKPKKFCISSDPRNENAPPYLCNEDSSFDDCDICPRYIDIFPDFSDRNQLGELYDKIQDMDEWIDFCCFAAFKHDPRPIPYDGDFNFITWLFDPARAYDCVYPWWIGRDE